MKNSIKEKKVKSVGKPVEANKDDDQISQIVKYWIANINSGENQEQDFKVVESDTPGLFQLKFD